MRNIRKASNASLYREIELLTTWLVGVGTRIPKGERMIQVLAERLMSTLIDALEDCCYAYVCNETSAKLESLSALRTDMTSVQTIVKVMFEWSSQQGQSVRIISKKQHAHFLQSMTSIGSQIGRWQTSLEAKDNSK